MLNLAPETESILEKEAACTGVSVDTLVRRAFAPRQPHTMSKAEAVPADDPVLLFLNARIAEAQNATPEEVVIANAEYRQWQQTMNENRHINGERLLFPEIDQQ